MNNQYTEFTEYYDLWITSGYYNYQDITKEANSMFTLNKNIYFA